MRATITTETKHYIKCPDCGAEGQDGVGSITHMLGRRRTLPAESWDTQWSCNRCHKEFRIRIDGNDVEIEATGRRDVPALSLLRLNRSVRPLLVVVPDFFYREDENHGDRDKRYYYEEHTCPTNITGAIRFILDGTDDDPHGLFDYLGSVEDMRADKDNCNMSAEDMVRIFKEQAPALLGIDIELDMVVDKVLRE